MPFQQLPPIDWQRYSKEKKKNPAPKTKLVATNDTLFFFPSFLGFPTPTPNVVLLFTKKKLRVFFFWIVETVRMAVIQNQEMSKKNSIVVEFILGCLH